MCKSATRFTSSFRLLLVFQLFLRFLLLVRTMVCNGTVKTVSLTETRVDASTKYKALPGVAHRVFLMPDRFIFDGFLFAFVAYFVTETPVRLQVWRPAGDLSSTNVYQYQLVCERRVNVTEDQLTQRVVVRTESLMPR